MRITAAWLWSRRRAVFAGCSAAALHGADWIDDDVPVELICRNPYPPTGVVTRRERILDDEIVRVGGVPVTTPARTAFDLGRHRPRDEAVPRLNALAGATALTASEVYPLIVRYSGARGVRRLRTALELIDGGAQSPRETWLRLLFVDAGLPRPTSQLAVHNGDHHPLARLDLGWERFKVGVEYDGDVHRTSRPVYVKDRSRRTMLGDLGWEVVYVMAEDNPRDVVDRTRRVLWSRDFRCVARRPQGPSGGPM